MDKKCMDKKILIMGTGRAGTTFLVRMFTRLGFETGWTKDNYQNGISVGSNSGLEYMANLQAVIDNYDSRKIEVYKAPQYTYQLNDNRAQFVADKFIVIIPIRKFEESAKSREINNAKKRDGNFYGMTNSGKLVKSYLDQLENDHRVIANYIYFMTKFEIETIFLNFETMIRDPQYLFDKMSKILLFKNVNFHSFCESYKIVSEESKPKVKI